MESFFKKLNEKFFQWLNHQNNSNKMIYEIKKKFMTISDAFLLFEVMNEQRRQTPTGFIIGPFQKFLADIANDPPEDPFIPINFGMSRNCPKDAQLDPIDLMDPMIQPYSKPLQRKLLTSMNDYSLFESDLSKILPPLPDLDDTHCHIFEMEMKLAGMTDMARIDEMDDIGNDVSSFFQ
jgi:hypothetical protein